MYKLFIGITVFILMTIKHRIGFPTIKNRKHLIAACLHWCIEINERMGLSKIHIAVFFQFSKHLIDIHVMPENACVYF